MRELNITLIEMAHDNAEAVFDLAREIVSAQAPSDLAAIWSTHAKRQFEMITKQTWELTEWVKNWRAEVPNPCRAASKKPFDKPDGFRLRTHVGNKASKQLRDDRLGGFAVLTATGSRERL
jgi:hypothetical protein